MSKLLKYPLITLMLITLSGCSWFSRDEVVPDVPDAPQNRGDIELADARFYCYGTEDREWNCSALEDSSQITTVIPGDTTVAVAPRPVTLPLSPSVTVTPSPADYTEPNADGLSAVSEQAYAILAFPEDSYAVQLIAMRDLAPVLNYANQVGIDQPFTSRTLIEGEAWYILLLGIYPDFETAEAARKDWVGTRVLKVEPWVRKLAPIQTSVKQAMDQAG